MLSWTLPCMGEILFCFVFYVPRLSHEATTGKEKNQVQQNFFKFLLADLIVLCETTVLCFPLDFDSPNSRPMEKSWFLLTVVPDAYAFTPQQYRLTEQILGIVSTFNFWHVNLCLTDNDEGSAGSLSLQDSRAGLFRLCVNRQGFFWEGKAPAGCHLKSIFKSACNSNPFGSFSLGTGHSTWRIFLEQT